MGWIDVYFNNPTCLYTENSAAPNLLFLVINILNVASTLFLSIVIVSSTELYLHLTYPT